MHVLITISFNHTANTISSSRSIHKQKSLLEAKEARRVLTQVKDDSSSLIGLRDSASFQSSSTRSTGRSSLISRIFAFDPELMASQVYQKQLRLLMKRTVRAPGRIARSDNGKLWRESRLRSEEIESQLRREKSSRRREFTILMHGPSSSRLTVIALMKAMWEGQPAHEERLNHRE